MQTLHHGFWIYFFMHKHTAVWQFVLGSMLPDYAYFALAAELVLNGQQTVGELLHLSPTIFMTYVPLYPWVIAYDLAGHSLVVWIGAFILSFLPVVRQLQPVVIGWGTHVLIDALTHAAYSNMLFYPLSRLNIHSPVSYWEPEYFAHEFRLVNGALMALAAVYLVYEWWRKKIRK